MKNAGTFVRDKAALHQTDTEQIPDPFKVICFILGDHRCEQSGLPHYSGLRVDSFGANLPDQPGGGCDLRFH